MDSSSHSDLREEEIKSYSTINGQSDENAPEVKIEKKSSWKSFTERNQVLITGLILFVLAILNMADRYIVSSVIIDIQAYFNISKATAGLLQTIYLLSFMIFSPLSGYLGDRFNRKYILVSSSLIWMASVIGGSCVKSNQLGLFTFTRVCFGAASATIPSLQSTFC